MDLSLDRALPESGLVVLAGATASGKSDLALRIARERGLSVVSADSRQIYRGMSIGTAAPSAEELRSVRHYFIGTLDPAERYSAYDYAREAFPVIEREVAERGSVLAVGGSYLYLRSLLYETDEIPEVPEEIRRDALALFREKGLEAVRMRLRELDPEYLAKVDPGNYRRLLRALEVSEATGRPFSSFHTGTRRRPPYPVTVLLIERDRKALYRRIELRTDRMIAAGLVEEVRRLTPFRECNALQTIGYAEIFEYLYGSLDLQESVRLIKKNTKAFARHQITSFKHLPTDLVLRL